MNIMNPHFQCPHCGAHIVLGGEEEFDGYCSCGNNVYESPGVQAGDISETTTGLEITTPHGYWEITDEEALALIMGLSTMLQLRLTRPKSPGDDSTILTRGRDETTTVRRPVEVTPRLEALSDY